MTHLCMPLYLMPFLQLLNTTEMMFEKCFLSVSFDTIIIIHLLPIYSSNECSFGAKYRSRSANDRFVFLTFCLSLEMNAMHMLSFCKSSSCLRITYGHDFVIAFKLNRSCFFFHIGFFHISSFFHI